MYELCMSSIWSVDDLSFIWPVYELYMPFVRMSCTVYVYKLYMIRVWAIHDLCMSCTWPLYVICVWTVYDLYMTCVWSVYELCTSRVRIVYELYMTCVWALYDLCTSCVWTVYIWSVYDLCMKPWREMSPTHLLSFPDGINPRGQDGCSVFMLTLILVFIPIYMHTSILNWNILLVSNLRMFTAHLSTVFMDSEWMVRRHNLFHDGSSKRRAVLFQLAGATVLSRRP